MLEENLLDPARHLRTDFDCGVPALNDYLQRLADQHRRRHLSQTYVLIESAKPARILGYYTLCAAQISTESLPEAQRRKLPRYPIPCFRLARLASHQHERGRGLGRCLLGLAVDRCLKAREHMAAHALIVDAKDEAAAAFYRHFGFIACADQPLLLWLPLGEWSKP